MVTIMFLLLGKLFRAWAAQNRGGARSARQSVESLHAEKIPSHSSLGPMNRSVDKLGYRYCRKPILVDNEPLYLHI